MKNKLNKILGVILPVAMVLALTVTLVPARTPSVEAADLRFSTVAIPKVGAAGKYVITPNTNIGEIAATGALMFASANITPSANITDLLKSSDSGATWTLQTGFRTAANLVADTTSIVAIKVSPDYDVDTTMVVATTVGVYQSIDGGTTFAAMPLLLVGLEVINDMDVALDERGRVAVIVGTSAGRVLVNSPATTASAFKDQLFTAGYNILAVALSPYFSDDEGIFAVGSGANTTIGNSFGSTKTGGNWNSSYGPAYFRDQENANADFNSNRARIAFPEDFNIDALDANIAFVGISSGVADGLNNAALSGLELGDVYKVIFQPTRSSAVDLDVRGNVGNTATTTNIYSIDVTGDAAAATIMVGTNYWATGVENYYWDVYYSTDSGETWSTPRESQPTGGTPNLGAVPPNTIGLNPMVNVLLTNDYATSGTAYAATAGTMTGGLSRTKNSGKSWRQISLVDWAPNGRYKVSEMDLVSGSEWYNRFECDTPTTNTTLDSYWHTTNGGTNYERFYSYANPTMPVELDGLSQDKTNKDVFFIQNNAMGKYWRSTDHAATFPRIILAKGARNAAGVLQGNDARRGDSIVNETSLYIIHGDGVVRYTNNLGRSWTEPEESIIPNIPGGAPSSISTSGNLSFVTIGSGANAGAVYVSTDAGVKYLKTLGNRNLAAGSMFLDTAFATNKFIYHTQSGAAPNNGIFKTVFNEAAPDTTEWEQIDNTAPTGPISAFMDFAAGPVTNTGGIFYYVVDNVTDGTNMGGLWRSTNLADDIRSVYPPHFTYVNTGLVNGDTLSRLAVATSPVPTFYCGNNGVVNTANYFNQVIIYADTLNKSADQVGPADKASDAGLSLSTDLLTMTVIISWKAKPGATSYQYQIARDSKFESVMAQAYTTAQEVTIGGHIVGQSYYWRVRTARAATFADLSAGGTALFNAVGDPIGSPVLSPWSVTRSYTIGTPVNLGERVFKIMSPTVGATDVSVNPTFTWTPFIGALNYEIMVAETSDFAIIEWSHTVTDTFYKATETLKYDMTYYWRVRAVTGAVPATGPAPGSAWVTGIITTEAEPVAAEEKEPTIIIQKETEVKVVEVPVPQPQPIPSYLLWIIIAVGAILVIALIVLIVRTRRVT